MKKIFLFCSFMLMLSGISTAQINELGIFAGGSNYIGDIGRTNYIYPNSLAYGGVYKWNMHPRYSLRANYTYSTIEGDDADSDNSYRQSRDIRFSNSVHEFAAGIEFHFFKYNLSKLGYTNTPYITLQAGVSNYDTREGGRTFNFILPVGLGYKFKLAHNIGMGIETSFRYTFKDNIDGFPYTSTDIEGNEVTVGNSNGNDWYVFTGFTLVYAFGRPGCYTGNF